MFFFRIIELIRFLSEFSGWVILSPVGFRVSAYYDKMRQCLAGKLTQYGKIIDELKNDFNIANDECSEERLRLSEIIVLSDGLNTDWQLRNL